MTKATRNSLTLEERCQIQFGLSNKNSIGEIAAATKRSSSIVSREIKRNKVGSVYKAEAAHKRAKERARGARSRPRKMVGETHEAVIVGLKQQWSPQQISGRLKLQGISISHEAIYQFVWADRARGGELFKNFRHSGKKYNKRSGKNSGRGLIPGRTDISERPQIVEAKTRIGDIEADTVIGVEHKGAIVTLVDRNSKLLLMQKVPNTTKAVVTKTIEMLKPFKNVIRTITFDNGKEFAGHAQIAKKLGVQTYFAKPYHSWERGLNEHHNGLIRQFLPKGTNFLEVTHKQVSAIQKNINDRPRNVLSFKTPNEVFYSALTLASTS